MPVQIDKGKKVILKLSPAAFDKFLEGCDFRVESVIGLMKRSIKIIPKIA